MPLTDEQQPWRGPPIIDLLGLRHPPRWIVLNDTVQIRVPETPSSFHAGGRHYMIMTRQELEAFITELQEARLAMPLVAAVLSRGEGHADVP